MPIDPTELKHEALSLMEDAEAVARIIDDLPVPAEVKTFVDDAQKLLAYISNFLEA